MTSALIVVDVQNDFCPGGSLAVENGDDVAAAIVDYVDSLYVVYPFIISTKDWHIDPGDHWVKGDEKPDYENKWPVHCEANTYGAELHPEIKDMTFDETFLKGQFKASYSGFDGVANDGRTLAQWLDENSVTELDIVGLATDYCVKATAIDAIKYGFDVNVLVSLTAWVDFETCTKAITEMEEAGINVIR